MSVSEITVGLRSARERPREDYDVAILGGGLAGLTLALQLKQTAPETSVFVAEKRMGPAPEAAFKVGESTVDVSAHYYAEILGLKDHIEEHQNPKFGLRYFLPANGNRDITARLEIGPDRWYESHSYQLDRGRFENELWRRVVKAGAEAFDGARVQNVELGPDRHTIEIARGDAVETVRARWIVDATGRASTLKRKLDLAKDVEHTINSAWFRLAGGLDYENWAGGDREWLGRMVETGLRHLSTTHLMGTGYWVWLIPLRSGPISIGIVADPRFHPFERISSLEGALDWLSEFEPQLYNEVNGRREQIEDFLRVEDFAYGSERVYSPDRWALVGEAGVFADPFYSPGSDFIAMGNTFVTDLVTRDLSGEDIGTRVEVWNAQLLQVFEAFLRLYTNQYAVFGNPSVLVPKVIWDHAAYWSISAFRFIQGKLPDLEFFQRTGPDLLNGVQLMAAMAQLFRQWHERMPQSEGGGGLVNMAAMEPIMDRVRDMVTPMDDAAVEERFKANVPFLEALAVQIFAEALRATGEEGIDEATTINPYALSLDSSTWDDAGLFDGSGPTIAEARERVPGVADLLHVEPVAAA